jgi:putative ABC transport system permease protein
VIFALKNLRRRPVRTLLAMLGVGIGVASIVGFTSLAQGFKESINEYARESGADLLVYDRSVTDPAWSRMTREEMDSLLKVPNVDAVAATSAMPAVMAELPVMLVWGRYPDERLMKSYEKHLTEGRLVQKVNEAMLGAVAAQQLNKHLGDKIKVLFREYTIVGIYQTRVSFENGGMIVHMDAVRAQLHKDYAGMAAFVYLKDSSKREETAKEIQKTYPKFRAVQTPEVLLQFDQAKYIDQFVLLISVAAILVGAIMVLSTMLMSVWERVREIGTLRAFGWSRGRILRMIWMEGLVISLLGGVLGIGLGMTGAETLLQLIPQGYLSSAYPAWIFIEGMLIAVGVGLFAASYPALQAARLAPAEALRYE